MHDLLPDKRMSKGVQLGIKLTTHSTMAFTSPPWINAVVDRVDALLRLSAGWDGDSGLPLDFDCAMEVLDFLLNVPNHETPAPQLVPTGNGGIQVEWHGGGIDIEVLFSPDQAATFFAVDTDGLDREGEVALDEGFLGSLVRSLPARDERTVMYW